MKQWISNWILKYILMYTDISEKAMAPTPVLLTGKSRGWRSLVGCSPWGRWGSDTTERLHFHFSLSCIGEGNGNPLQCSCLGNPRDGVAWWAAVYGVTKSRTRLKWLSSSILIYTIYQKHTWNKNEDKNWEKDMQITEANTNKNVRRAGNIDISNEVRYTRALNETKGFFYHGKS